MAGKLGEAGDLRELGDHQHELKQPVHRALSVAATAWKCAGIRYILHVLTAAPPVRLRSSSPTPHSQQSITGPALNVRDAR